MFPKKINKKTITLFISILFILYSYFQQSRAPQANPNPSPTETSAPLPSKTPGNFIESTATVSGVIDGDTIELEDGSRVRYIGIDAPERKGRDCFSEESKRRNEELVLGKTVRLVKDVSETDKYKRLLRYVYLLDHSFVNAILVEEGFAYTASYPPDVAMQDVFRTAQKIAKEQKRGLWLGCQQ